LRNNIEIAENKAMISRMGWNVLVGANDGAIMANDFEPEGEQRDVFGSGDASERIVEVIGGLR